MARRKVLLRCPNRCKGATFDGYTFVEWHTEIDKFGGVLGDMPDEAQPMEGSLGEWWAHKVWCNGCGEEAQVLGEPDVD